MHPIISKQWFFTLAINFLFINGFAEASQNLSCYQCTRNSNTECSPNELLPCPAISDRCVTHIMKDDTDGFVLKRECGLGPCTFNDMMMNKGLGLDTCDRSKHEYFCIFCCRENGCNKNTSSIFKPSSILLICSFIVIVLLDIFKNYQPPYVSQNINV